MQGSWSYCSKQFTLWSDTMTSTYNTFIQSNIQGGFMTGPTRKVWSMELLFIEGIHFQFENEFQKSEGHVAGEACLALAPSH